MAYSVWAEPKGFVHLPFRGIHSGSVITWHSEKIHEKHCIAGILQEKLKKEIERLANCHRSPVFSPHVTLVGGIWLTSREDIFARARAAAKQLKA